MKSSIKTFSIFSFYKYKKNKSKMLRVQILKLIFVKPFYDLSISTTDSWHEYLRNIIFLV